MQNKKGLELQFSWIFAVIVGAMVFFLMIYFAVKIIRTGSHGQATVLGAEISVLLEPFGTTIEESKTTIISFSSETRLYNKCSDLGTFGTQHISMSVKSFGKWQEKGAEIPLKSKYIFSQKIEQGKTLYIFPKPFKMPFKIADLMLLTTRQYCFVQPPTTIEQDIKGSGIKNIKIDNCSSQDIRVCFNSQAGCNISVYGTCFQQGCEHDFESGYVLKEGEQVYYVDSLLYSAIISDKEIYNCNVRRLMLRTSQLALLYAKKSDFSREKCNPNIALDLYALSGMAKNATPDDLFIIKEFAKKIEIKNDAAVCEIF